MSTFKVGDVVQRTTKGYNGVVRGDTYEVSRVGKDTLSVKGSDGCFTAGNFRLVISVPEFLQLHELKEGVIYEYVSGGSTGVADLYTIKNNKLHVVYCNGRTVQSSEHYDRTLLFKKRQFQQKTFKLKTLGYNVEFREKTVVVGCQALSLTDAKEFCKQFEGFYKE